MAPIWNLHVYEEGDMCEEPYHEKLGDRDDKFCDTQKYIWRNVYIFKNLL